jgi:hypothetical protein
MTARTADDSRTQDDDTMVADPSSMILATRPNDARQRSSATAPAVHNLIEAREHVAAAAAKRRLPSAEPKSASLDECLSRVRENPFSLRRLPPSISFDERAFLLLIAVRTSGSALICASKELRCDEDIALEVGELDEII